MASSVGRLGIEVCNPRNRVLFHDSSYRCLWESVHKRSVSFFLGEISFGQKDRCGCVMLVGGDSFDCTLRDTNGVASLGVVDDIGDGTYCGR